MTALAIVTVSALECSLCMPDLAGSFTTVCDQHLLEINRQPRVPIGTCDVCDPKPDDRMAVVCPDHLQQLAGWSR